MSISNSSIKGEYIETPIIGYHRSVLSQKFGIPRQPNLVTIPSRIEMIAPYDTVSAFEGIEAFSHLWITWRAHHNQSQTAFKPKVRPPRLGGNAKRGVFATRSTYRPSQLGLSVVKLIELEIKNNRVILHISGADMVDATPIIDIKPYIAYSDAIINSRGSFTPNNDKDKQFDATIAYFNESLAKPTSSMVKVSDQANLALQTLMKEAIDSDIIDNALTDCNSTYKYHTDQLTHDDIDIIIQLIAQDPRPAYRQDDTQQHYVMRYKRYDVKFKMNDDKKMCIIDVVAVIL